MTKCFKVGYTYKTRSGGSFTVAGEHTKYKGYETVYNWKGQNRYNRSTESSDNGRTTGRQWSNDCLVYPPVVLGKVSKVSIYFLNLLAKVNSSFRKIYYKVEYKYFK